MILHAFIFKPIFSLFVLTGILLAYSQDLKGQDGVIDPCFQTERGVDRQVNATAVQADGKIVIGGWFEQINGCYYPRIGRLNQDGTPDYSFDPGSGPNSGVVSILVQPDEKILISGDFTAVDGVARNGIARLNSDGSLDQTFSIGPWGGTMIWDMALQSDGKIVICGNFYVIGVAERYNIARLNPDGSSDIAFNAGRGAESSIRYVYAVAIQSDGKILIGGSFTSFNSSPRNKIVRLNPNGTLDTDFSTGAGPNNNVYAIEVQSDGNILVGGDFSMYNGTSRAGVVRLFVDGTIDQSFVPPSGAILTPRQMIVQPDGNILVGSNMSVCRLTSDGAFDPDFNRDNPISIRDHGLTLQSDGKIVVGGWFVNGELDDKPNRLARLDRNGDLETAFMARRGFNFIDREIISLITQPDGKILLGGGTFEESGRLRSGIHRFTSEGLLDPAFDTAMGANNVVRSVALQPDGKILVGGYFSAFNGIARSRIVRLNSNGTVDLTFDPGTGASGRFSDTLVRAFAIQGDGKIIVGGDFTTFDGVPRRNLVRLNPNGSVDPSFDSGSMDGNFTSAVTRIIIQPDGQILVAGFFNRIGGTTSNGVARLDQSGSVDTTFNVGSGAPAVYAMGLQPDGKVVIGGQFLNYPGNGSNNLVRLESNGNADPTFLANIGGQTSFISDLVIQRDGKIIAGGSFEEVSGVSVNCVTRLNANGTLDATFVPLRTSDLRHVYSVAMQNDGKILFGGSFTRIGEFDRWGIARLLNPSQAVSVASISGRVTAPSGQALRNVVITLTDQSGNTQKAVTSSFGMYSFPMVATDQIYTISASSKRFRFSPRIVLISGSLTGLDFVGLE